MLGVYHGKNVIHGSMGLVARKTAEVYGGEPFSDWREAGKYEWVVSIVLEDLPKLMARCKHVWAFIAAAREDYKDHELLRALMLLEEGLEGWICHSQYTRDQCAKFMRETLHLQLALRLMDKFRLVTWAVDRFDWHDSKDRYTWVCPWVWVYEASKKNTYHHQVTGRVQAIAAQRGWPMRTIFRYDNLAQRSEADFPNYVMRPKVKRGDYDSVLREYGAFLSTSSHESFGIYYLELLQTGAVGVFEDYEWVRKLLPGYPLIVQRNQIVPACLDVMARYDFWRGEVKRMTVPFIRERYDFERHAREFRAAVRAPGETSGDHDRAD